MLTNDEGDNDPQNRLWLVDVGQVLIIQWFRHLLLRLKRAYMRLRCLQSECGDIAK